MTYLPINLDDLLSGRTESERLEVKASFSEPTLDQITRTICAFANDYHNLNGGYIVLGVAEEKGCSAISPCGLEGDVDEIQRRIRGQCNRIEPQYQPVFCPETYQNKTILVIWVPGGELRPYQCPTKSTKDSTRAYYIRIGSETIEAKGDHLTQLMQLTAKVPFDDRRNQEAKLEDLSPTLVRNFLENIGSRLVSDQSTFDDPPELYRRLKITSPMNGHEVPRNVGLLFFAHDPERFFSGARIEIVQFGDDAGGNLIEEKIVRGPLHEQVRQALDYLNGFSGSLIRKLPNQAEAQHTVAFPYEAMEEALVNAIYHRSYDGEREPTKVYLYPDRMEITSYPGPMPGLNIRDFEEGRSLPPVPNRNRRIGEFLKDLRLAEGRGTGIPKIKRKMRENQSPAPKFDFDETRTYFRVTLPAHPQFVILQALRESGRLWSTGERERAIAILKSASQQAPTSGTLLAQIVDYQAENGDVRTAEAIFQEASQRDIKDLDKLFLAMARAYMNQHESKKASELLQKMPSPLQVNDVTERAILFKRMWKYRDAHTLFQKNYNLIKDDPKAVHEFAQTKMSLARQTKDNYPKTQLNREAAELLRRAIQLSDDPVRTAWCWHDLAVALSWLNASKQDISKAYETALELLPNEHRFKDSYEKWKHRKFPSQPN
jgi:ATP-dependent DNA helicase RecG